MKFSTVIGASLAGTAMAAPAHQHNAHKRDVVFVTQTNTVVVTAGVPLEISGASTTFSLNTVNTAAPEPLTLSTTYANTQVVPTTTESAAPQSSAPAPSQPATDGVTTNGGAKGICYSPYANNGGCKSLDQIKSELAQLDDFAVIRLYGVDCSQTEFVLQAKKPHQKIMAGIYFMDQIEQGIQELAAAVAKYGSWDDISTVSIGNELVNSGQANVAQVAGYVQRGRTALSAAGYTGPVISIDTFIAVINNPGLCEISDYMGVNAHAYFDFNTEASGAGAWTLQQIQRVWSACNGAKNVLITEAGWPSAGQTYGKAIASPGAQKQAVDSIVATCGADTILFTAFNDYWKAPGPYDVEQNFGLF